MQYIHRRCTEIGSPNAAVVIVKSTEKLYIGCHGEVNGCHGYTLEIKEIELVY